MGNYGKAKIDKKRELDFIIIIWLASRTGKKNQILHCDWPERSDYLFCQRMVFCIELAFYYNHLLM